MKEVRVNLTDEQYMELKEKTSREGLTISEYFRNLLSWQSGTTITIDFSDITDYALSIGKLIQQVSGICSIIYQSNAAYEQDIEKILSLLREINDTCDATWIYVNQTRKELYDQTRKELVKKVKANGYKRRRPKL